VSVAGVLLLLGIIVPRAASAGENSGYAIENVATARGTFSVKYVRIRLTNPNLRIYTLTGTSGDCDQCVTKSLDSYIRDVNGFAGIHGSYFCPADYPSCSGQEGSYFWLWYNSLTKLFSNSYQNQFNTSGSLFAINTSNTVYAYRTAKSWPGQAGFEDQYKTKLQALFSNGPGLMYAGENVTEQFPLDEKQRTTRGARAGVGFKGNDMFLVVTSGATVIDLGAIMETLAMEYAVNLDGGGSTALWYDGSYRAGPGRTIPNAIVFAEASGTAPEIAEGPSFFAYDEGLRGGFRVSGGDVRDGAASEIVVGTGEGLGPQVRIFNRQGAVLNQFFAFESGHRSGVRVATCNLAGDEKEEIVVAEGRGQRPRVRVFRTDGQLLSSFSALDGHFTGGVNLACGDTDGNGRSEIVVAASAGGGPQVMVYDMNGRAAVNFYAYDSGFRGGINVAVADVNGDGHDEIITGPEAGAPHVQMFEITPGRVHRVSPGFQAFDPGSRNGVDVAAADLDGDGRRELIVSRGPGAEPLVKVYSLREQFRESFYVFAPSFRGGIHLGAGDTNNDGREELFVTPWSAGGPQVRMLSR
jgi:hypothetical protein